MKPGSGILEEITSEMLFESVIYVLILIAIIVYASIMTAKKKKIEEMEWDIVKTRIVDVHSRTKGEIKTSTSSAMKRAAVGGVLLGRAGAEYGATTAKKKIDMVSDDVVVFKVWWDDGSKSIKKVKRGSKEYELFLEYLED